MRIGLWVGVLGPLLSSCTCEKGPVRNPSGGAHDGGIDAAIDAGDCEVGEGPTTYLYDPTVELTTFPDDLHTIAEPRSRTGLAVRLIDEARAWFIETLPDGFTLVEAMEVLDGFGTSAGIILRWSASLDPETFTARNVRILDLSRATEVEWEVEWHDDFRSAIVYPLRPLEERTRYGVVVTTDVEDCAGRPIAPSPTLEALLDGESADPRFARLHDAYAELLGVANFLRVASRETVAAATVFTTQSVFAEDDAVAAALAFESPVLVQTEPCAEPDQGVSECAATLTAQDFVGKDEVMELAFWEIPAPVGTYELPVSVFLPGDGTGGPFPVLSATSGRRGSGTAWRR